MEISQQRLASSPSCLDQFGSACFFQTAGQQCPFFVDSIFSLIKKSRQRFTPNRALKFTEVFASSTKIIYSNQICKSINYTFVSWFFVATFFLKTIWHCFLFFLENLGRIRGVSGPYQSRIRAVSEPYQSHSRAVSGQKLKIFHFSWRIGFFVSSVVLVVCLSSPHFYLRAVR